MADSQKKQRTNMIRKCSFCQFTTLYFKDLERHIRTHTMEKPFKCPVSPCTFTANQSGAVKTHVAIHSNLKPYKCPTCPFRSKFPSSISIHMNNVHSDDRPFRCTQKGCGFATKTKNNLVIHLSRHSLAKPVACPHPNCKYKTKTSRHLKTHEKTHSTDKLWQCVLCPFSTTLRAYLHNHIKIHTQENYAKCEEPNCNYSTVHLNAYKNHKLLHQMGNAKPFSCKFCPSKYRQVGNLGIHIKKNHTVLVDASLRPFKCPQLNCQYAAKEKATLKTHVLTHTPNVKSHVCPRPNCQFKTHLPLSLSHHLAVHNEVKPFKCNVVGCDYSANRRAHLQNHISHHHPKINVNTMNKKVIKCHVKDCPFSTKGLEEFSIHLNICHQLPKIQLFRI